MKTIVKTTLKYLMTRLVLFTLFVGRVNSSNNWTTGPEAISTGQSLDGSDGGWGVPLQPDLTTDKTTPVVPDGGGFLETGADQSHHDREGNDRWDLPGAWGPPSGGSHHEDGVDREEMWGTTDSHKGWGQVGGGTGTTDGTKSPPSHKRPRTMQSDDHCPTTWKVCGLCNCCFEHERNKTSVLCTGENITDIPQDLPLNTTHLTFRRTMIVRLTGEMVDEASINATILSKLRRYVRMGHLSLNENEHLEVIDAGAFEFPKNTGLLSELYIQYSPNLRELKPGALGIFRRLSKLTIASTGLHTVPDWSFFDSGVILEYIDLKNNKFLSLPSEAFTLLKNQVDSLLLDDNPIQKVEDYAFANASIKKISLDKNVKLTTLEEKAFAGVKMLEILHLSNTHIGSLPTRGLQKLKHLFLENVESLKEFPKVLDLSRHMELAKLTYPYHCCAFTHVEKQDAKLFEAVQTDTEGCSLPVSQEYATTIGNFLDTTPLPSAHWEIDTQHRRQASIPRWLKRSIEMYKDQSVSRTKREGYYYNRPGNKGSWGDLGGNNDLKTPTLGDEDSIWHVSTLDPHSTYTQTVHCGPYVLERLRNVTCTPQPDAFSPCEDVMGFLWLRIIVWFVVSTALFGNFVVLIVTLGSRFKVTVPKFLMCNLAFADLSLGVYLLLLASIDLHTMGVYFAYAIPWQSEGGCQVAGFLAIFATSLSVFTLTVITLERWYAISHAIHLTKRLRLRQASTVMVCGWLYAAIMASFPLFGISSYGKTSICLPMETSTPLDQAFVLLLLICNAIAFMIIFGCYVDMYRQVRGNNTAARRNDANIAKRMSVLVFTDFICLFPIAFFGLTAAAGSPFITVTDSKILLVFFFPFNSCANPFLYAIFTKQFHKDLFCTLDRLGICKKKAAKYRFTYTSNPMSLSHSRNYAHHVVRHSSAGSVLTTYLSDVHRSSKASITINTSPKITPQHTPKEKKKVSPKPSKQKESKTNSPKLVSINLNGYPSQKQRLSIEVSDPQPKDLRKLSIVREVSQTSDEVSSDMTNYVLEDAQSHKSKDKSWPAVRSASLYAEDDACRGDRRKQSQVTCCSTTTEISHVDSVTSDTSTMPTQDTIEEEDSDLSTSEDEEHGCNDFTLQQCMDMDSALCRDHKYDVKDMTGVRGQSPETSRLLKTPSPVPEAIPCSDHNLHPAGIDSAEKLTAGGSRSGSPSPHRSPLMKQKHFDAEAGDPCCSLPSTPNDTGNVSPNDGYVNTCYSSLDSPEYSFKGFR